MDSIQSAIQEVLNNNGAINISIVNNVESTNVSINCSINPINATTSLQRSNISQDYVYTGAIDERVLKIKEELGINL